MTTMMHSHVADRQRRDIRKRIDVRKRTDVRKGAERPRRRPDVPTSLSPQEQQAYNRIPDVVDYVIDPSLMTPVTEARLFGENADDVKLPSWSYFPEVPEEDRPKRSGPAKLSGKDEMVLFLRYNYARCRLATLMAAQSRRRTPMRAREMVLWSKRSEQARANIVRSNMALVLAMAKRTRYANVEFSDLISEGNLALLRAADKFDVARGFKFATYACSAILKSFSRLSTKVARYHRRFPIEYDPEMECGELELHKCQAQQDSCLESLRDVLDCNRARLSDVERTVVNERFALVGESKRKTLAEVGKIVGLTNERVRQIEKVVLAKIREVLV
jgi:RNA polymerase primary sigma factor